MRLLLQVTKESRVKGYIELSLAIDNSFCWQENHFRSNLCWCDLAGTLGRYRLHLFRTKFLLRRLPSRPNKAGLNLRPSTKRLSYFSEIWYVDDWLIYDGMPYDPIQYQGRAVKVMEVWNLRKWPIQSPVSSTSIHVIKRLAVNYVTPRQYMYLNFNWTYFWYWSSLGVTWPSYLRGVHTAHGTGRYQTTPCGIVRNRPLPCALRMPL